MDQPYTAARNNILRDNMHIPLNSVGAKAEADAAKPARIADLVYMVSGRVYAVSFVYCSSRLAFFLLSTRERPQPGRADEARPMDEGFHTNDGKPKTYGTTRRQLSSFKYA